ncbi:MAG: hypothetical protein GY719_19145 [bacterium]|nr:hypothetical protein [bacterium]
MEARDLVQAKLYGTEEEVIRDALRHLLRARPDARLRLAIHRYENEEISLARAAEMAGVSWAQMREILLESGARPRLGPETVAEAEDEIQALRDFFADRQ